MNEYALRGYVDALCSLGLRKEAEDLLKQSAGPLGPAPVASKVAPVAGAQIPKPMNAAGAGIPPKPAMPMKPPAMKQGLPQQAGAYAQKLNIPAPPSFPGM